MTIAIRTARREDVPALVKLRMANAERHVRLDPAGYRMPQADDVHHYFDELLSESREDIALLVAEVSGTVVGMTEVDLEPTPPEHQILSSLRQAQVHTVVLEGQRGQGVGKALFAAAERYAAQHGVARLIAPILAGNSQAVGFYSQAGFRDHGIILRKELPVNPVPGST